MAWAPKEETRKEIEFWLECFKVVTVFIGIIVAFVTVNEYRSQQVERDRQVREHEAAVRRELRQPYEEKKLSLYLEASRVVAHLAATPTIEKDAYEARFWELYWGELAFVESTTGDENMGGPNPSVERLMVNFCHQVFPGQCSKGPSVGSTAAAIELARQASKEIRHEWENPTRSGLNGANLTGANLVAPPNPSKTPPTPN
jgi:hypothetical protein